MQTVLAQWYESCLPRDAQYTCMNGVSAGTWAESRIIFPLRHVCCYATNAMLERVLLQPLK